jgi:peroxiredoxin
MRVPNTSFYIRVRDNSISGPNPYKWSILHSTDIFQGKRVLVFSLPGAFTPTCSTYQVPGFESNYFKIRNLNIDEVYCVSVNDAFVMNSWAKNQGITNIKMIPDGNGAFTRQIGMLVDKSNIGLGHRSWRYAMIVDDGIIEKWFEEPGKRDNASDDPYGETSPENILAYLENIQHI